MNNVILGPLISSMVPILKESVTKVTKFLYLHLCGMRGIYDFLDEVEIVRTLSATRLTFVRYLVKEPIENVIFEVFEAEVIRQPWIQIKVDVSSRVVKTRNG